MASVLRLILGDQLNYNHPWFDYVDDQVTYVMMEIMPEATYVRHHIQKLLMFFAAMRSFAGHLRSEGHVVRYFELDHPENKQSFETNITDLLQEDGYIHFEYQRPDEYRLEEPLKNKNIFR